MTESEFEPNIIVFACNWGGYPAAKMAGKERAKYPPSVKIIRVMCGGSVDMGILMQTLERGADGVIIAGCEEDRCHFKSGNAKSMEGVDRLKRLISILGLDARRIKVLRMHPADGIGFAEKISEYVEEIRQLGPIPKMISERPRTATLESVQKDIEDLTEDTGAFRCVECGKCTGVCPIPKFEPEYSVPRMKVLLSADGIAEHLAEDKDIWLCTTCGLCNSMCPFKVDYCGFIAGLREGARSLGHQPTCAHKGVIHSSIRVMANSNLTQNRLQWVGNDLRINEGGDVFYFVGCIPHLEAVFSKRELRLPNIPTAVVKLMNAAGVVPTVSNDEKCCGHDLLWTGDENNFLKLMDKNLELIKKSKAKKVVFSCPECYRTFLVDYQDFEGDLDFEMMHVTEYLDDLINAGKLNFPEIDEDISVTYHDSCRLGIHLEVTDPPRRLIEAAGMKLFEMENTKNRSYCCGNCAWTNCSSTTMKMQLARMKEAKNTGADYLLTSDPKCQIHLSCAISEELPIERELVEIPIKDIAIALAELLEANQCKQYSIGTEKSTCNMDSS